MRAAKVQASLRIRAVSPEPPLLAHTSSESRGTIRQKARSITPLNGWACMHSYNLSWRNARRHKFAWRGSPSISLYQHKHRTINWAASSEFVSSSIPSWKILTAHAQPFRGARDLAFCLKVPLDSLLVRASSGGSGETAQMRRLAWTFAARIGHKYQIRLTLSNWKWDGEKQNLLSQIWTLLRLRSAYPDARLISLVWTRAWQNHQNHESPAKTLITLCICIIWSESFLCMWRSFGSLATCRPVWVLPGRIPWRQVFSWRGSFVSLKKHMHKATRQGQRSGSLSETSSTSIWASSRENLSSGFRTR